MKRLFCIVFAVIFLAGCSSKPLVSQNPNNNFINNSDVSQNEKSINSSTDTPDTPQNVVKNPSAWDAVSVKGENNDFMLHSLDFLDENTGWIIQDRNNNMSNKTNSQLMNTQDGGVHWNKIGSDNMSLNKIKFIGEETGWAISQSSTEGTANSNLVKIQYKILYTQDGGADWDVQWQGKQVSDSDSDLWFHDKINGFALVGNGMLVTRDSGKQWSSVSFRVADFKPQKMSFTDAKTGWVMGTVGHKNVIYVLHTTDGGVNWQQQFKKEYSDSPTGSIGIDFIDAKTGWFLTSNMATWNGDLYYTNNSGGSWKKINQIKCVRPTPKSINFISPKVGWIPLDVGAGPIDGGLMFTRDGGKSFNVVDRQQDMESLNVQKIVSAREVEFISGQQGWAIGMNTNYGDYLVRTVDGGKTWTQVYPQVMPFKDISFVNNRQGFGLGHLSDYGALLYTADGGDSWESIKSFMQDYWPERLSFIDENNGWILAELIGSNKSVILKTADGGRTWTKLSDISESTAIAADHFKFFDAYNGIIIGSGRDDIIYRTKDGGKTWEASTHQRPADGISQFSFISSSEGWEICNPGNYKSAYDIKISHTTDGVAWKTPVEVEPNAWTYAFSFLSDKKALMLIEEPPFNQDSRMKLLVTEDAGKTWTSHLLPEGINGNTLVMLQNQLPMQFTDDSHGWILLAHGLLRTQDGGKTWMWTYYH